MFNSTIFSQSRGTGFIISKEGFIITCYHVVKGSDSINVTGINNDFYKKYDAYIYAKDTINDIALLKINDTIQNIDIKYCFKWNNCEKGEEVFTLGFPKVNEMGNEIKLTNGIINSVTGFNNDMTTYQISSPIQPGNSGGPLFNKDGFIIGVVNAKLPNNTFEDVGYAIKSIFVENLLSSLPVNIKIADSNLIINEPLTEQVKIIKKNIILITAANKKYINKDTSSFSYFTNNSTSGLNIINLLNGKQIFAKSIYEEPNSSVLKYDYSFHGKEKQSAIDLLNIYSVNYANKTQKIFYRQDSAIGFDLSVQQMNFNILGERDAIKNYKVPWITAGGFVAGILAAHYLQFYSLITPAVYATAFGLFTPRLHSSPNLNYSTTSNYNYLEGYRYTATRKKVKNALLGSIVGIAAYAITSYAINVVL